MASKLGGLNSRNDNDRESGFTNERDARRVMEVLPKRFGKYGLRLHPEKTQLIPFRRPTHGPSGKDGPDDFGPGTFDFLGFTHYWARSRRGNWVVKQKTARGRFTRAVQSIAQWCKRHRREPILDQHERLNQKLTGHYAYYGITGNSQSLSRFRHEVTRIWRKWLARRRRSDHLTWERFYRLLERYPLAPAIAVHSTYRHAAKP